MSDSHSPARCRVLIAEDSQTILLMMEKLFRSAGADVTTCSNGRECVDIALSKISNGAKLDLIVVDIRMPQLSGNDACKAIRAAGFTGPIIAFTSNATVAGKKESEEYGITKYFNKTVLTEPLVRALLADLCS